MDSICEYNHNCNTQKKELFIKNGYQIFECNQCKHRFAQVSDYTEHVAEVYSDSYFFDGKAGYPNYFEEKDILIKAGRRYAKLISKYCSPGKLLDVGCAAGFITKGFDEAGWECIGIEPNETMAAYGRKKMHLDILTLTLEEYRTNIKFDLVCLIEVIGHFYNLNQALNNVSELVKEGGYVLIESWNVQSFVARIQGKKWHEYSPPSVLHWFSDLTLAMIFKKLGFKLIAKGHPRKRINVRHAVSLLDEHTPDFHLKKKIFNRINNSVGKLSLIYPLDDLKWYIFQKQAIV